jgi:OOP family OmpA-OmpF porin
MKKILFTLLSTGMFAAVNAQTELPKVTYKKRPTLVVNFLMNDFGTADAIKRTSVSDALKGGWSKVRNMDPGLGLQYLQGITQNLDFSANVQGSFVDNMYKAKLQSSDDKFLLEADAGLHLKLLSDKYFFTPYLSAGIGGSMWNGYYGAYVPLGVGFQFSLGHGESFIFIDGKYKTGITENANEHITYSVGFGGALTSKPEVKVIPPPPPPPPVDTDNDGIVDSLDKCPTTPGLPKYQGCPIPDTDNDGVNDEMDKCPTVFGSAKYQGCPVPDTDGDGINDEMDKCPTVPGTAKYQGCPIPDTDGDGVNDELDQCPNQPGPASNNGCPKSATYQEKVSTDAKEIYFATGSATLLKKSFPALNHVATVLKENADLGVDISGHTDNVGKAALNKKLSERRAAAVSAYLKKKGVKATQMTSAGYGMEQPIADNSTKEGRAQNRRVELKLKDL